MRALAGPRREDSLVHRGSPPVREQAKHLRAYLLHKPAILFSEVVLMLGVLFSSEDRKRRTEDDSDEHEERRKKKRK